MQHLRMLTFFKGRKSENHVNSKKTHSEGVYFVVTRNHLEMVDGTGQGSKVMDTKIVIYLMTFPSSSLKGFRHKK